MATQYAFGKIVTDGLVLALDAADRNSYVSGSTTWNDLSRSGFNGTLINGPTFNTGSGGSIVFDGVDDYITTNYNPQFQDFTACVWFNSSTIIKSYERLLDKDFVNGFWIGRNSTNSNSWGGGIREASPPYGRYITLTDNQWHYIVSIRNGTTHTIYGDGITNTVSGTVSSTTINASNLWFGRENNAGPSIYRGNIALTQIYNRALSATEVLQNYNSQKSRFGL